MKHGNSALSKELIKVELPPCKIWKADVSSVGASSFALVVIRPLSARLINQIFTFSERFFVIY